MKRWHASQRLPHRHLGLELPRRPTVRRVVMLMCPWGDHNIVRPHRLLVLGLTPCRIRRRVQSRAPSQVSGLDVVSLLNRLVDRQHDDLQRAEQREQSARAEAYQREKEAKAETYQREQAAKADAEQREERVYQRDKEARAEARAMAKAEVLQREKQVRREVEKEMEIDRLRRKLAKKEAKERQPRLSSASHLVGAPTPSG